ncbi:hypothetical protein S100072_01292 [Bacillus velezensis]|nr:hypothetical protein S100072_01292 [Bacillus velezensis]
MKYDVRVVRVGNEVINYVYIIFNRLMKQIAIIDPAWDMSVIRSEIEENNSQVKMIDITHPFS